VILENHFKKTARVVAVLLIGGGIAFGHVTIQPKQSVAGKSERYTMKVPTEHRRKRAANGHAASRISRQNHPN